MASVQGFSIRKNKLLLLISYFVIYSPLAEKRKPFSIWHDSRYSDSRALGKKTLRGRNFKSLSWLGKAWIATVERDYPSKFMPGGQSFIQGIPIRPWVKTQEKLAQPGPAALWPSRGRNRGNMKKKSSGYAKASSPAEKKWSLTEFPMKWYG
ncbi:MAG: hypothetical protein NTY64_18395 [Deltaproteobacteria bacterium]|nr:hypothetical protein [Deltaproteobacteria bacterium]